MGIKGNAVLFSEMTLPEGREDAVNDWFDNQHMPAVLAGVPGILSAMRYRSVDGPYYLSVYELDQPDTPDSAAFREHGPTPDAVAGAVLDSVSGFTRYTCAEVAFAARADQPAEPLDAAVVFCVFFTVPFEREAAFGDWLDSEHIPAVLECPDWLMARRFDVMDWDPERHTHMILHYLNNLSALDSEAIRAASASDRYMRLAAEPWFDPRRVTYHRRGRRFLKSGRAPNDQEGEGS